MYLLEIGFVHSTADPCLYMLNAGEVIFLVYVDDILFTETDEDQVSATIEQLKERFHTVDLRDARFLEGMAIGRNVDAGTILRTQEAYAKAVLDKFVLADERPAKTPAMPGPICIEEEEILSPEDTTFFRSATGSLLYLIRGTRPDITHSVMVLAKSMSEPGPRVITKLKRVLRCLKGTVSIGSTYSKDDDDGDKLTAYVDSDHVGDEDKGYSTTGIVLHFSGGPVDWRSTKQQVVATSTVEAEYVAMSKACLMVLHFRNLLESMNETQEQATVMFEDNSGAVSLSRSAKIAPRTKNIDVKFHHVRSLVADGVVDVTYIKTELERVDILTKSSADVKFLNNRLRLLGV